MIKKTLLLILGFMLCNQLFAQLSRTINVTAESSLSAQLGIDATTVTDLVVTGTLSASDMTFINDVRTNLPMLSTFDLGGATLPSTTFAGMQSQLDFTLVVPTPSVTSIILPNSIENIGKFAFLKFTNLQSVTLPSNLKILSEYCFCDCPKLNNIILPSSLEVFNAGVFAGCTSLESISLPAKIKTTSYQLFQECTNLKSVSLPDGLTDIIACSFAACFSLDNIVIPNTVKSIGWSSFSTCQSLKSITLPNNPLFVKLDEFVFMACFSLSSITLPPTLTQLENGAFCSCVSLTELRLPSSVKTIAPNLFNNCAALVSVICDAEVPPVFSSPNDWGSFSIANCKLTVPPTSASVYKVADVWKDFGTNISSGINNTTYSDLSISSGNNSLFVSSSKQLKSIEVYNLSGVLLASQMASNTASFNKLSKGVVIVKVMDADGQVDMSKQIIK